MKNNLLPIILIIIGIALLGAGGSMSDDYDSAPTVVATVTHNVEDDYTDADGTYIDTDYIAYGSYTYNGREYTNVKLGKFTSPKPVGSTISIRVNADSPGQAAGSGEGMLLAAIALIGVGIFLLVKKKKTA